MPLIAALSPLKQNSRVWNSRAAARPLHTNSNPLHNTSRNLSVPLRSVVMSTTPPVVSGARHGATHYQQKAESPGIKEAMPEYGEAHARVLLGLAWSCRRSCGA